VRRSFCARKIAIASSTGLVFFTAESCVLAAFGIFICVGTNALHVDVTADVRHKASDTEETIVKIDA
jgi:hypothetical protein